jgi:hypothetical protein
MIYRVPVVVIIAILLIYGCTAYDIGTPDSEANRKGFEQHLKLKPTEAVSQVYFYADELGADVRYQLSFKCNKEIINQIVTNLSLKQEPANNSGLDPRDDLRWWKPDSTSGRTFWKREEENDYFWELWYSEKDNIAFYHEYSK